MSSFYRLSHTQQVVLAALAAALIVFIFFRLLWQPANDALQNQREQYASANVTLNAVEALAMQIQELEKQESRSTQRENLSGLVNDSLQARQLEFTRLQQLTAEQVQIRLDNVDFGEVLVWLYDLENTPGLVVSELAVRPVNAAQPGLVNVTVGLSRLP